MADILHHLEIAAAPAEVYEALVTQSGLRGWWTTDATAEPRAGTVAEFGFYRRARGVSMRFPQLAAGPAVGGECARGLEGLAGTRPGRGVYAPDQMAAPSCP